MRITFFLCADAELIMPLQVIFALDKEALQQLRSAGAHAFYIADVQLHASSQGDQGSTPLTDLSTRSRCVCVCVCSILTTCSLMMISAPEFIARSSFGSDEFKAIVRKKPLLLMRVLQVASLRSIAAAARVMFFLLQAGYNVLLSDCDVVFLDNPFTTLINSKLQVRSQSCRHIPRH